MRLKFVYLGYWVKGSSKMDYKKRFSPLEVFTNDKWVCVSKSKITNNNTYKLDQQKHGMPIYLPSED